MCYPYNVLSRSPEGPICIEIDEADDEERNESQDSCESVTPGQRREQDHEMPRSMFHLVPTAAGQGWVIAVTVSVMGPIQVGVQAFNWTRWRSWLASVAAPKQDFRVNMNLNHVLDTMGSFGNRVFAGAGSQTAIELHKVE